MRGPGVNGASTGAGNGVRKSVRKSTTALMAFAAVTLAVVSPLHLTGAVGGGSKTLNPGAAGLAEAVIGVVLAAAAIAAWRAPEQARPLALGAVSFAIIGFLYGLSVTTRSGEPFDIAYHSAMLPVLIGTLVLLLRPRGRETPTGRETGA